MRVGSQVGMMNIRMPGKAGTSCIQEKKEREKKRKEKSLMKKATQNEEEKEKIGERKKRTHLLVLHKFGEMIGNLTNTSRSLPIVSMMDFRSRRRHESRP